MRRLFRRRVAIADRIGIGPPIGVLTMAILPDVAPLAFAATDVVLDKDEVALLESLASRELAAGLGDDADILVTHDDRRARRRMLIELHIGAADAADLHLQESRVFWDIRHRIVPEFGL